MNVASRVNPTVRIVMSAKARRGVDDDDDDEDDDSLCVVYAKIIHRGFFWRAPL